MINKKTKAPPLHTGPWRLSDLKKGKLGSPKNGLKVFSCFHCGGGSTMGYKLAGFEVLGGVEIDPEMMELYRKNHGPKLSYLMGVQEFRKKPDKELPKELFDLDVLDGSPPCSSFSMAGSREKAWGEKKKFREGQAEQVLDDLFFDFIAIADKLKPKVVVAENVKGLVQGNARGYVKEIFAALDKAGYETQLFLLNASRMGVPQVRERTFFIARRKDLKLPKLQLSFEEDPIPVSAAFAGLSGVTGKQLSKMALNLWKRTIPGTSLSRAHPKHSWFAHQKPHPAQPIHTIIGGTPSYHWKEPRYLGPEEIKRLQSFPDDYDFLKHEAQYVCGMSVPPLMMQRVSTEVARALLAAPR